MKKVNIMAISFGIVGLSLIIGSLYFLTKFKNAVIELGNDIKTSDFVKYGTSKNIDLDLTEVDTNKVGIYKVQLKYIFVNYNLTVTIKDTTPPFLEIKNVYKPLNSEIKADDFVTSVTDKSETEVIIKEMPVINDYGDYPITIIAKDAYENETVKDCILSIGWAKKEFSVEVGNEIKISDLVYDIKDKDTIKQSLE